MLRSRPCFLAAWEWLAEPERMKPRILEEKLELELSL